MRLDTDINRYLCATAYLDFSFRDKVIERILKEDHRAIGICHDVDLPLVITHCLAARRRVFVRDIVATVSGLLGLLTVPFLIVQGYEESVLVNGVLLILLSIVVSVISVAYETWARHVIVTEHFLTNNYDPKYVNFKANRKTTTKLDRISEQQNANVIVYSGFSPFVGSGVDLGGWSFSLNVNKGKEDLGRRLEPQSFEIVELYDCLINAVQDLQFDGLTIEDKIFVNGKDLREDRRLLPDPLKAPAPQVESELINEFKRESNHTHSIRHYMCVRITDWKGELSLSVFLRLTKNGSTFFTEANYFLLTPLAECYRKVDSMQFSISLKQLVGMLSVSVIKGILLWFFSIGFLFFKVARLFSRWSEKRKRRRFVAEDPTFDYGAFGSLREYASSSQYRRYFQKLDKEMYVKTLEGLILDQIIEFLERKDVDVSELKDRRTTILNHGVIVTGGAVKASNLAVGQRASASSST